MANIIGTTGNDTIAPGNVQGGAGTVSITGGTFGDGDDSIQALGGNDSVDGGGGNDSLYGGTGDDTLLGGPGNDLLMGFTGNDVLYGVGGTDPLYGEAGADYIDLNTVANVVNWIIDGGSSSTAGAADIDWVDLIQGSLQLGTSLSFVQHRAAGQLPHHLPRYRRRRQLRLPALRHALRRLHATGGGPLAVEIRDLQAGAGNDTVFAPQHRPFLADPAHHARPVLQPDPRRGRQRQPGRRRQL